MNGEEGTCGVAPVEAPSDDEIRKVWNQTQDPIATVRAFLPAGVAAAAAPRICEYNGGTCTRSGCSGGCQAMRMVRERRAAADAAERNAGVEVREQAVPVRMRFGKRDDVADQAQRTDGAQAAPAPEPCEFPVCAVHHICDRQCSRNAGAGACPECNGAGEFESALHNEKCEACAGTGKAGVAPVEAPSSDVPPGKWKVDMPDGLYTQMPGDPPGPADLRKVIGGCVYEVLPHSGKLVAAEPPTGFRLQKFHEDMQRRKAVVGGTDGR